MGPSYKNNINILFIAVLERSHCVEYVETLNYEKNPNIDQDINNFMYSRVPNRLPRTAENAPKKRAIRH